MGRNLVKDFCRARLHDEQNVARVGKVAAWVREVPLAVDLVLVAGPVERVFEHAVGEVAGHAVVEVAGQRVGGVAGAGAMGQHVCGRHDDDGGGGGGGDKQRHGPPGPEAVRLDEHPRGDGRPHGVGDM